MRFVCMLLVLGVAGGCGTRGGGGGGGGGTDAGPRRDGDIRGDDAGMRDAGGGGIDAGPSPCPSEPPSVTTPCDAIALCTWDRCGDEGVVIRARCETPGSTWSVTREAPCEPYACETSEPCGPGMVCRTQSGGAFFAECTENPCARGPIIPECACSLCPSGFNCSVYDRTVSCTSTCTKCP